MKRRQKRMLMAGAALVAVIGLAGFAMIATSEDRPVFAALGSTWAAVKVQPTPFQGANALDLQLELKAGEGTINRTPEAFSKLCDGIVGALPMAGADVSAAEVFRVDINVISGGKLLFNESVPVSVDDGRCLQAETIDEHRYHYPGSLAGWELRGSNIAILEGSTLDTSFEWTGAGDPDLDSFDYALACKAVLDVPPAKAMAALASGAIKEAKIWAAKPLGDGRFTAKSRLFDISPSGCEAR